MVLSSENFGFSSPYTIMAGIGPADFPFRLRLHCSVSFPSVFADENAASSHCSVFKQIRYENNRRSHCPSKTMLLIPFSKQKPFVNSCQQGANRDLNAIIVIKGLLAKECAAFSNVSIFGLHTENGSFQNAPFSNLSVFISVFEKNPVFTAEQCERKAKTDNFYSVFT